MVGFIKWSGTLLLFQSFCIILPAPSQPIFTALHHRTDPQHHLGIRFIFYLAHALGDSKPTSEH
ncbi:hypothetical protein HK44_007220 [Pseudomonas fluorescens HK44]|uniref:Uncharacterized protein n=1 Tax=Pseudomonas fluorescens HK44 TaxID=1042209 RepID=A0A010RZF9_PSEFL|nr:hypothetical protein HK44_007220 [Pseudomonas fluorescens HK44]